MTSLSEAPAAAKAAVAPAAAKAAPAKRGGVDYSKFDSIVDSDDEKPEAKASAKAATPEKPHCHNCHKDIDGKVLRCGICKKVSYCSAKCQKEDWSFHKRVCKKPEEPKKDTNGSTEKARSQEDKENKKKSKKEEKIVDEGDDDEKLDWYRHREWKPAEAKKEFKPQAIAAETAAPAAQTAAPTAGSVWNAAGTWEDKDVTDMAKSTLQEQLNGGIPDVEVAGGSLSVKEVHKVEGEASKPVIRGKMRHMFDLGFKVTVVFKWMDASGRNESEGTLSVSDFTNDCAMEGDIHPEMQWSWKGKSLEAARRKAVEDAVGARSWPPSEGTLIAHVAQRMMLWSKEFQTES